MDYNDYLERDLVLKGKEKDENMWEFVEYIIYQIAGPKKLTLVADFISLFIFIEPEMWSSIVYFGFPLFGIAVLETIILPFAPYFDYPYINLRDV